MKGIILCIIFTIVSGCSALSAKYGEYKVEKARESFISKGLNMYAFQELTEGLKIVPLSVEGLKTFQEQYDLANRLGENIKKKRRDTWRLEDFQNFTVYLYSKESYETLPLESKSMLKIKPIDYFKLNSSRQIFISQLEDYLALNRLRSYPRDILKEWYSVVKFAVKNSGNSYQLKEIEKNIENILIIKVYFTSRDYFNYRYGLDYILPKVVREKEGKITPFIDFVGYKNFRDNRTNGILLRLDIKNMDDYAYNREVKKRDDDTIIIEKRRVRISGFYDILEQKSNRLLDRKHFSQSEDYEVVYRDPKEYINIRDNREYERNVEDMLNDVLSDAFFNIKNIENK